MIEKILYSTHTIINLGRYAQNAPCKELCRSYGKILGRK